MNKLMKHVVTKAIEKKTSTSNNVLMDVICALTDEELEDIIICPESKQQPTTKKIRG